MNIVTIQSLYITEPIECKKRKSKTPDLQIRDHPLSTYAKSNKKRLWFSSILLLQQEVNLR